MREVGGSVTKGFSPRLKAGMLFSIEYTPTDVKNDNDTSHIYAFHSYAVS